MTLGGYFGHGEVIFLLGNGRVIFDDVTFVFRHIGLEAMTHLGIATGIIIANGLRLCGYGVARTCFFIFGIGVGTIGFCVFRCGRSP